MIIEREHGGQFWKMIILFLGFAGGLGFALFFIVIAVPSRPQSEPVRLISTSYEPQSLCPGDVVEDYDFVWEVKRPAVLFVIVSHLRAGGDRDTVIGANLGSAFATGMYSARTITDLDANFTIPDLPPGDYERVLSIGTISEDSEPVFLVLPYTIRADCVEVVE